MDHGIPDPVENRAPEEASFRAVARRGHRGPAVIALGAIALLAAAIAAKQEAPATSAPSRAIEAPPSTGGPVVSPAADVLAPAPSIAPAPPARNPAVTPLPTFASVPVAAGPTRLTSAGRIPVPVSVDLPAGWQRVSAAMYVRAVSAPAPLSISAWRIRRVYTFPCRWSTQAYADPSLLDTAAGQAQALASWWGQDPGSPPLSNSDIAPLASRPKQTSIAGHAAWYVEVLIPTGLDLAACDGGQLILWESSNSNVRYSLGPSEVNRIWVVTTDGAPLIIDAGMPLAASAAQQAELQSIIDSIVIR